jgi:hypothetical protein
MRKPLFAAAIVGVTLTLASAQAGVAIEKLYDKEQGWIAEYVHSDGKGAAKVGEVCDIQGKLAKGQAFYISITADSAFLGFRSVKYDLQDAPLGDVTIDIDGAKFAGTAKGRKRVVTVSLSSPPGFLSKFKDGAQLATVLPGVKPDTWSIKLDNVAGAVDALVQCAKEHLNKDAIATF